jgi:3,4-dihydroxy-2-butanone 4-phosphate synthase
MAHPGWVIPLGTGKRGMVRTRVQTQATVALLRLFGHYRNGIATVTQR